MKKIILILILISVSCAKEEEKEYCSYCIELGTMNTNQPLTDYFCGTLKQVEAFEKTKGITSQYHWICNH